MEDYSNQIRMFVGQPSPICLGYSEAACHLRVAGEVLPVMITGNGMAQIFKDGRPYSFPVSLGEAGIYQDTFGFYAYGPKAA